MAKIKLMGTGYQLMKEGEQVLQVTAVDYKEDFGRMLIHLVNKDGQKHIEKYDLLNSDGTINVRSNMAYGFFARTCLGISNSTEQVIDDQDIVGKFIRVNIKHVEGRQLNEDGTKKIFVNLGKEKYPATGYEELDDLLMAEFDEI